MLFIVKQQLDLQENLKTKFVEGAKERKELYNKMLELKGELVSCSVLLWFQKIRPHPT